MNNHQRGIYQPLAENVPLYDLADDESDDDERSRLPLMVVIALVVLAAFTGVVWLAYNQGVARGRAGAAVVINAPDGPVRTAPGDAGGSTPFTGLKIYGQPVPPDQEAQASNLAPATSEASVALPPPPAAPPAKATTEIPPVRLDPGPPISAPRPAVPQTQTAQTQPAAASRTPPPQTAQNQPAAVARPAAQPPQTVQAQSPAPRVAPVPAPTPAEPPSAASAALSGAAVLQIGSFESVALADGAWATFRARHSDVVGELSGDVQRADLGARGIWYRLRVGPFKDRPAAVTACEKLRAQGATCIVAAP